MLLTKCAENLLVNFIAILKHGFVKILQQIVRPVNEQTSPRAPLYPMQTLPMPECPCLCAGFWQASEDTMLYTSHCRKIVFAATKCLNKISHNRNPANFVLPKNGPNKLRSSLTLAMGVFA